MKKSPKEIMAQVDLTVVLATLADLYKAADAWGMIDGKRKRDYQVARAMLRKLLKAAPPGMLGKEKESEVKDGVVKEAGPADNRALTNE